MNSDRIRIEGKKRKLLFQGECLDPDLNCEATCCRLDWAIYLTPEEYQTGLYVAECVCSLTTKPCEKETVSCAYRVYPLKKNDEGACIHLGQDNRCLIYESRPAVCREFTCRGGWRLVSVFPADEQAGQQAVKLDKATFIGRLKDEMVFVSHPLMKLHTVFCNKLKGEITFIKEMVGGCGKFYSREGFSHPHLDDDLLLRLIRLFDRKDTLQEIHERFCREHAVDVSREAFSEIVWILNKHNIILSVIHFKGLLAGMGEI